MKSKSFKFSVLLLYPDYESDGPETYFDWTVAKDANQAVRQIRRKCVRANKWEMSDLSDLAVLLVIKGHHHGLSTSI